MWAPSSYEGEPRMKPQVRPMARADWPAVREIFQQGVAVMQRRSRVVGAAAADGGREPSAG